MIAGVSPLVAELQARAEAGGPVTIGGPSANAVPLGLAQSAKVIKPRKGR